MAKGKILDDSILEQSIYGPGSTGSLDPKTKATKKPNPTKGKGKRTGGQ